MCDHFLTWAWAMIVMGLILACLSYINLPKPIAPPCIALIIESLGACDSHGKCGVKYTDGTYGENFYPVIGDGVCPINHRPAPPVE